MEIQYTGLGLGGRRDKEEIYGELIVLYSFLSSIVYLIIGELSGKKLLCIFKIKERNY